MIFELAKTIQDVKRKEKKGDGEYTRDSKRKKTRRKIKVIVSRKIIIGKEEQFCRKNVDQRRRILLLRLR